MPFNARDYGIFNFFKGYTIVYDSATRKYDPSGNPTEEEFVTFDSLAEAQKAVIQLNKKFLLGRRLFLEINYPYDHSPSGLFGKEGCVVLVKNLPYLAGLVEILEFFSGFNLTAEDIVRSFVNGRQLADEAFISFQSPGEAQRAINQLNMNKILGKPLYLSMV